MQAVILLFLLCFVTNFGHAAEAQARTARVLCQSVYRAELPQTPIPADYEDTSLKYRRVFDDPEEIDHFTASLAKAISNTSKDPAHIKKIKSLVTMTTAVLSAGILYYLTVAPVNEHFAYIEVGESASIGGAALAYFFSIKNKAADPDFLNWITAVRGAMASYRSDGFVAENYFTYSATVGSNTITLEFYIIDAKPYLHLKIREAR